MPITFAQQSITIAVFVVFFVFLTVYLILKYRVFRRRIVTVQFSVGAIIVFILIRLFASETKEEFLWNILLVLIVVASGILLIQTVLKEIKQRQKLELLSKNLELANKRLEQIDAARKKFLSFASHQLRAPMTIIKGYATLLLDKDYLGSPEKSKPIISKIIGSTEELDRLIKNFLDARAIEEGKMSYNLEPIDLVSLTSSIVEDFRFAADEKNLTLGFETSKPLITINADRMKLHQVIQNLIDNAIKYTNAGFVRVAIKDKENRILLTVSDSGRGIAPEIKDRLFGQFVREEENAEKTQGNGLGLYIAKEIVTAHQGKIWAESEGVSKGSTFYVELPIG
jgi:signal transduction histidine kinase